MANNYIESTGVLVLDKVTPVIKALFGAFNLDPDYPGNGLAYISKPSESFVGWGDITKSLKTLCADLGVEAGHENSREEFPVILGALENHFHVSGAPSNTDLKNLIEHHNFDFDAEVEVDKDTLFFLASKFDDGHGLSAIKEEGCYYCDKLRLGEQGGWGSYIGKHFSCHISSQNAEAGAEIDAALSKDNLPEAARILAKNMRDMLGGINGADTREQVRSMLVAILASES